MILTKFFYFMKFLFVRKLLNKPGEEILLVNPVKNFGKNNGLDTRLSDFFSECVGIM